MFLYWAFPLFGRRETAGKQKKISKKSLSLMLKFFFWGVFISAKALVEWWVLLFVVCQNNEQPWIMFLLRSIIKLIWGFIMLICQCVRNGSCLRKLSVYSSIKYEYYVFEEMFERIESILLWLVPQSMIWVFVYVCTFAIPLLCFYMVVEVICLIEVLNADIVILNIQTGWHLLRWMLAPSIS